MDENNNGYIPFEDDPKEDLISGQVNDSVNTQVNDTVDTSVNTTVDTTVDSTIDTANTFDGADGPAFDTGFETPDSAGVQPPEAPEMDLVKAADGIAETKKRNYERYLEQEPGMAQQDGFADAPAPDMLAGGFESSAPLTPIRYDDPQPVNLEGLEEPVTMGEWLVTMLLMMVPCANIILMFVWAFSKTEKKSKSNFFKVELIMMGIILAIYFVVIIIIVGAGVALGSRF